MSKSLAEIQEIAYKIAFAAKPTKAQAAKLPAVFGNGDEAMLYKYWKEHKHVGVPYGLEYEVNEGGYALVTTLGIVLYWDGVNEVQEL